MEKTNRIGSGGKGLSSFKICVLRWCFDGTRLISYFPHPREIYIHLQHRGIKTSMVDHWCHWKVHQQQVMQRQTAVTAYLKSKQLLLFAFARQSS